MDRRALMIVGGFVGVMALGIFVNPFFLSVAPLVGCAGMCAIPMLLAKKKKEEKDASCH